MTRHSDDSHLWQHTHTFGQDQRRSAELRTTLVIILTGIMMVIEIVSGIIFGSMALLADGLHMTSHTTALMINLYAYIYGRRHAQDKRYSFGTGKVNTLGGFTGAVLLAGFALVMAASSTERIIHPVPIIFNQAILVAFIGLVINGICAFIFKRSEDHHDYNLKAAYYHVLADALTSVLAIIALLSAKYFGFIWMDPIMGIVGAVLICRWSWGLLRATSAILLDKEGSQEIRTKIRECIENVGDNHVSDLHLWSIGPNIYSVIILIVTHHPQPPQYYKNLLPSDLGIVHVTIELHQCFSKEGGI